ncbi:MAG: transposase, partial [Gemmataceae bacterium]
LPPTNAQAILAAVNDLLSNVDWQTIQFRKDCRWAIRGLVVAALLWAWAPKKNVTARFDRALRMVRRLGPSEAPFKTSYQAFLEMLVRWTPRLRSCLVTAFRARMEHEFPDHFRSAGFVVLAADGSKLQLARTASNQAGYSPAKCQKKKGRKPGKSTRRSQSRKTREQQARHKKADSPQMAMTAILHVGLQLLWDWQLGSSDTSEREQLRSLVAELPEGTLLTADCGFSGYELWSELIEQHHEFVIRVGGNVRLLKQLGYVRESQGTVYLWPNKAARQKQPPLVLRLVEVHDGRRSWYLVTSVRETTRLSDDQIADIYRMRWRVEVFFRDFKQTFGRAKLRSHKAAHAACEAEWSLLGFWGMLLYTRLQRKRAGCPEEPISVAGVIKAVGQAMAEHRCRPEQGESLEELLLAGVVDGYSRKDKRSRGYPRKKYEPEARPPEILQATAAQKQLAQQLKNDRPKKALTA